MGTLAKLGGVAVSVLFRDCGRVRLGADLASACLPFSFSPVPALFGSLGSESLYTQKCQLPESLSCFEMNMTACLLESAISLSDRFGVPIDPPLWRLQQSQACMFRQVACSGKHYTTNAILASPFTKGPIRISQNDCCHHFL